MKIKPEHIFKILILLCSTSSSFGLKAFNEFMAFGDSTLDSGYYRYHSTENLILDEKIALAVENGSYAGWAGNGLMASVILADKFGLTAEPIGAPNATNYAVGGAFTNMHNPGKVGNVPLTDQISTYLETVNGNANPKALYVISIGNNDVLSGPQTSVFLDEQSSALAASAATLQQKGAEIIIIPNSYRYANLASYGGEITDTNNAKDYARQISYNAQQWSDLTTAGVEFIPADMDSVFKYVVKNPERFGFTASSVLANHSPSSIPAFISILSEEEQQKHLFIDGLHVTTAGQIIEADYMHSLLSAPCKIALIAENAIQGSQSRIATIQQQISIPFSSRIPNSRRSWAVINSSHSEISATSSFSNDSGNPVCGMFAVDYQYKSDFTIGVVFSEGNRKKSFSAGGNLDQNESSLSFYATYQSESLWGDLITSYSSLKNEIQRTAHLGSFTDLNHGQTSGHSYALTLRAGKNLKMKRALSGPIIGFMMQQTRVNDFTETGISNITSLSFDSQKRNSNVMYLGWRSIIEWGKWTPFFEATWNHELNNNERTVSASLMSVSAQSFHSLATRVEADWGTISVGSSYTIAHNASVYLGFSKVVANSTAVIFGSELALQIIF